MTLVITFENVTKTFGSAVALCELTVQIPSGRLAALLGPNGAGKTTALHLLMGFLRPTSGRSTIEGLDCFAQTVQVKQRVGFLSAEPTFIAHATGRSLLRFVGEVHGLTTAEAATRAGDWLDRLGLSADADRAATGYSLGMQKKLALGAALIHDPQWLILDEPLNGLDPAAARTIDALLRERVDRGRSVLLSTHLLDRVERIADHVVIMDRGRLVLSGSPAQVRAEAASQTRHDASRGPATQATLEDVFLAVTTPSTPTSDPHS